METTRWRRYGKDRLYVKADDGTDIGWWDLASDEPHPASDTTHDALLAAVAAWRLANALASTDPTPTPAPEPVEETPSAPEPVAVAQPEPEPVAPEPEPEPVVPEPAPTPEPEPDPEPEPAAPEPDPEPTPPARPELEIIDGVAGGSAAYEFRRRHDKRQETVQTRFPRAGKFLLAVFDDPQTTKAWAGGASGEQTLGESLARVAGPTVRVLHDRRIPKSTANIDHMVVCAKGVYVIDAKRYVNRRPDLRVTGGLLRERTEYLTLDGKDKTSLVEGMHKQLRYVHAALEDQPDLPIRGVLCFIDANWPLLSPNFTVRDVLVLTPRKLRSMLVEPGPLDADRIADLQWQLHEAFPRAKN